LTQLLSPSSLKKIFWFFLKYVYALVSCIYLFVFGFFIRRNRDILSAIAVHFGLGRNSSQTMKPILPQIEMGKILGSASSVTVLEPIFQKGNVTLLELCFMNQLIQKVDPKVLFEMGTFDGRTSLNMAANTRGDAQVFTLDLPKEKMQSAKLTLEPKEKMLVDKPRSGERYRGSPYQAKIVQLYGDTADFDFSPYFNAADFIFIDASHAYDYVLNDSRIALKLLRNGKGVILWHDYAGWPGVTRALNELFLNQIEFKNLRHIQETNFAYLQL